MILYKFSKQSISTSSTKHLKCLNNQLHVRYNAHEVQFTRTDMSMTSSWVCPSVTFVFLK